MMLVDDPTSQAWRSRKSLVRDAADLERQGYWKAAADLWEAACLTGVGVNRAWCEARLAWCRRRMQVEAVVSAGETALSLARAVRRHN
ncbi:ANR family transcriptional regulator [Citrobacter koseri]|uniref:ANR family transcriptional regulator n=1 Tax=Citrobacter koseri TaxID=545 RepID=UPI000DFE2DED|nr:ANR family transcriptional regulator [Citrobacter koseri]STB73296.1 Uncharacterised protein [Citrobacter koseri]STT23475.1 Uncharacterised protein [Citrobacter koseri]